MVAIRRDEILPNLALVASSGVRIQVEEYDPQRTGDCLGPHTHSFFELILVEHGRGHERLNGHEVDVGAGDLLLLRPGDVHDPRGLAETRKWIVAFAADAVDPVCADGNVLLRADAPLLRPFVQPASEQAHRLHLAGDDHARWLGRVRALRDELAAARASSDVAARALLTLLLVDVARAAVPHNVSFAARARHPLTARALGFIEANYQSTIGLTDVARALRCSAPYLADRMMRDTGRTVLNWIRDYRMTEARRLLLYTDAPVHAVAERVGYTDVGYFIRHFRQIHQSTPHKWRALQR